jgi:tripartite-type tricarboxylate transporter receptor subunit TctC
MRASLRRRAGLIAAVSALGLAPGPTGQAWAQEFPSRPVTFVVPAAAGGPTDVLARILAEGMAKQLGRPVVVENVAGAGGTLGIARVARAAPDGHTALVHGLNVATTAAFMRDLPYDIDTALDPVGLVNQGPYVWLTRRDFGVASPTELFARMREAGGQLTVGHGGVGALAHLCGVLLAQALNTNPVFVPYRGAAPAMNDLIAGHVDMFCSLASDALPQVRAGTVRAIATTGRLRLAQLPEVPTFVESGVPVLQLAYWNAIWTPRGTPPAARAVLTRALDATLGEAAVVARLRDLGGEVFPPSERTPEALDATLRSELQRWRDVARTANLSVQ